VRDRRNFHKFWSKTNTFPYIFHICGIFAESKKEDVTIVMILLSTSFTEILSFELVSIWF
jgi:hypothetical protein